MPETSTKPPVITLMTDFGLADPYVGIMKGVILDRLPAATLVDLTHAIEPQNIPQAAFLLSTAVDYFPDQTVHLVVVDPGVGSERRPIAVKTRRACFVAPDNGVLSWVLAREPAETIIHLTNPAYWRPQVSATFHGRDIFAPVAAHLAGGVPLDALGTPIQDLVRIPVPQPVLHPDGRIQGQIQHIDRFGNAITDIPAAMLDPNKTWVVQVAGRQLHGVAQRYSAVAPGDPVCLIGSHGYLEIAVYNGNAAITLGLSLGDSVLLTPR